MTRHAQESLTSGDYPICMHCLTSCLRRSSARLGLPLKMKVGTSPPESALARGRPPWDREVR